MSGNETGIGENTTDEFECKDDTLCPAFLIDRWKTGRESFDLTWDVFLRTMEAWQIHLVICFGSQPGGNPTAGEWGL